MAKPILIVRVSKEYAGDSMDKLKGKIIETIKDYHVLVVLDTTVDSDNIKFEVIK